MKDLLMALAIVALIPGNLITLGVEHYRDAGDGGEPPQREERVARSFVEPTGIPDGDPAGVTLGPLDMARTDQTIHDVVLGLQVSHAYSGDLSVRLHYDSDNDGVFEASTPVEVYLARVGAPEAEELWAYPIELGGTYFFRDEGWGDSGEDGSLQMFDGLPGGGSFYLSAIDNSAGDTGTILAWTVSVATSPVELSARRTGPERGP